MLELQYRCIAAHGQSQFTVEMNAGKNEKYMMQETRKVAKNNYECRIQGNKNIMAENTSG